MRFLLSFLLLFSLASAYKLQKEYTYTGTPIYASDLFPDISEDFELLSIPSHLQHFQISQKRLFILFKQHAIPLEEKAVGLVHFTRANTIDYTPLKEHLRSYYLKKLPYLNIKAIHIRANRYIKALPKKYEISFKKQLFKQNRGSFKISSDAQRIFFSFSIEASYSEFQARSTLKKGTTITQENTKMVVLPFTRSFEPLIGFEALDHVEAKHRIKAGKAISLKDVTPIPLVKRGAIVNVKLIEGNILIHFTATALKSGNMHERIFIKKSDGSKLKAKIIGKDKVTIE